MPKLIPYLVLPLGMSLLLFRYLQVGYRLFTGRDARLIASHEAEEMLDDLQQQSPSERGV